MQQDLCGPNGKHISLPIGRAGGDTLLVALALTLVALAGCGGVGSAAGPGFSRPTYTTPTTSATLTPGHYPPTSAITSATTLRTSDFPTNHVAAFSATATNVATLQRFYAEMMALKPMPKGTFFCPEDSGVWEHVSFYAQGKLVLQAMVNEGGCRQVVLGAYSARQVDSARTGAFDVRWSLQNTQFWPRFYAAFGTTQSALQNGIFNNTSAPYAPTPSA